MKYILPVLLTSGLSVANSQTDYSGIWQDNQGIIYSIHQSSSSIAVGELRNDKIIASPTEQSTIEFTSNELDLAISGYGFFVLVSEDGSYNFTRNGEFQLSSTNEIINAKGEHLLTEASIDNVVDNYNLKYTPTDEENTASECSEYFGCAPDIEETRDIIISPDGLISYKDKKTGQIITSDRIILAWIAPGQFEFSGYPISVKNKNIVSYFYPGDKKEKSPSIHHNARIIQGSLEKLTLERKAWKGHFGNINDNKAIVSLLSEQKTNGSLMSIDFLDKYTAHISFECNAPVLMCNSLKEHQDKELKKIY